ncbi:hypothetical protein TNCV_210071 [Trichonephila clavipes]|uniref:Uncharacterized protein n=1 Tax=Trichonephila clavipes TaxID=2585209 RepID=A0A8X6VSU0_TRICX|nr:hypothetical protein TNCV_210071 [Trichonephila clavipes]
MPPDRQYHQIKVHEYHLGYIITPVFSTMQVTARLYPNVEEKQTPCARSGGSHLPHERTCGYLEYLHVTIHLQTSMLFPGFEPWHRSQRH